MPIRYPIRLRKSPGLITTSPSQVGDGGDDDDDDGREEEGLID